MAGGKLTALAAARKKEPGRYGDGDGLWLQVRDAHHRSWLLRYKLHGKERQMGLGPFPEVSLADARDAARVGRALARQGLDPIEQRRAGKAAARAATNSLTFREVAGKYISAHEASWRNEKHRYQWRATMDTACEELGSKSVASITTGDVLRVLEPMWREKTETASRLRGRIESVLDYAKTHGWRTGENPARWKGHLKNVLPASNRVVTVEHLVALPWREIGTFIAKLRGVDGVAARALEFTVLTAARTGEIIGAQWGEIDMQAGLWTVPATRMKAGRDHRVPLSNGALTVLEAVAPLRDDRIGGWVFPGRSAAQALSDRAMLMLLRRMGHADLTVHGFRSAFRDWAAETTNYPREVAEQALAHTLSDKVEAAYRRGDLLERRRRLMEDWASFCDRPALHGEVVPLRRVG